MGKAERRLPPRRCLLVTGFVRKPLYTSGPASHLFDGGKDDFYEAPATLRPPVRAPRILSHHEHVRVAIGRLSVCTNDPRCKPTVDRHLRGHIDVEHIPKRAGFRNQSCADWELHHLVLTEHWRASIQYASHKR